MLRGRATEGGRRPVPVLWPSLDGGCRSRNPSLREPWCACLPQLPSSDSFRVLLLRDQFIPRWGLGSKLGVYRRRGHREGTGSPLPGSRDHARGKAKEEAAYGTVPPRPGADRLRLQRPRCGTPRTGKSHNEERHYQKTSRSIRLCRTVPHRPDGHGVVFESSCNGNATTAAFAVVEGPTFPLRRPGPRLRRRAPALTA